MESASRESLLALNLRLRLARPSQEARLGLRDVPAFCVARDGRRIEYAPPGIIAEGLDACLGEWRRAAAPPVDALALAEACARFWIRFIALHPFFDANGRTARAFLRLELSRLGWTLDDFTLVDRVLLEGEPQELMDTLGPLFLLALRPEARRIGGHA